MNKRYRSSSSNKNATTITNNDILTYGDLYLHKRLSESLHRCPLWDPGERRCWKLQQNQPCSLVLELWNGCWIVEVSRQVAVREVPIHYHHWYWHTEDNSKDDSTSDTGFDRTGVCSMSWKSACCSMRNDLIRPPPRPPKWKRLLKQQGEHRSLWESRNFVFESFKISSFLVTMVREIPKNIWLLSRSSQDGSLSSHLKKMQGFASYSRKICQVSLLSGSPSWRRVQSTISNNSPLPSSSNTSTSSKATSLRPSFGISLKQQMSHFGLIILPSKRSWFKYPAYLIQQLNPPSRMVCGMSRVSVNL